MPKVSVVIPTYNRADFICDAIESVLAQTYKDYEVIVVDDGSTDNTREVLKKYGDRIKYIYQENKRQGAARNTGIKNSTGEYIAFLDSDDTWLPHKLEKDVACIESDSKIGLVYSNVVKVYSSTGKPLYEKTDTVKPTGDVLEQVVLRCFISPGSNPLVRKECFMKVGLFNESRDVVEDYEMVVRIASEYHFGHVNEITTKYRVHKNNDSSNADFIRKAYINGVDVVFHNERLLPRILHLKNRAYSNAYIYVATRYFSVDIKEARANLLRAIKLYPKSILDRRFIYTFIRALLGNKLYFTARKIKRYIQKCPVDN